MRSKKEAETLDLERGVVTTAADTEALERMRSLDRLDPVAYLQFLRAFAKGHPPSREIPPSHEPFRL